LVLQGETIAARGPTKKSASADLLSCWASPKSQFNFVMFRADNAEWVSTA